MPVVEAADDLPEVLGVDEATGLHAVKDPAPALAALLSRGDLVKRERSRPRGKIRSLSLEQRPGRLLVARRQLIERTARSLGEQIRDVEQHLAQHEKPDGRRDDPSWHERLLLQARTSRPTVRRW